MPTFDQIREAFPGAKDLSDEDILQRISDSTQLPIHQVANDFGYDMGRGGKNAKRLSASIDNYQAGYYGLGEAATVPGSPIHDWFQQGRQRNEVQANVASGRAHDMGAVDRFSDVHSAGDFGDYAVGLGIQSLPYMGEAIVGGMTGGLGAARLGMQAPKAIEAMRLGGAAVASYPSGVADILGNQREQAGETDLLSAAALGVPYAAANVIGVEGALARGSLFRNGVKALDNVRGIPGAAARLGTTAGKTAVSEGASETFQEGMNQFGRMAVDPNQTFFSPDSNERFFESAVGGATLGGLTAGVGGGWRKSERTHTRNQVSLLPDAQPDAEIYAPQMQESATNTPVASMPGFAGQAQDPLQGILNPGPSVNIDPNATSTAAAAATNAVANPPTDSRTRSSRKQPNDEPAVTDQERSDVADKYRVETVLDDGTDEGHWRVFGKDIFKRSELNAALDKQAQEDRGDDPAMTELAKEINKGAEPMRSPKALKELATSLVGSTPEKTAYNLNAAIEGGHKDAERLAATYEAITGKESPAWLKMQEGEAKPAKAKKEAPAKQATAATQPKTEVSQDDPQSMLRATLMALYNNNEKNVDIAMDDIAEEKVSNITAKYGVSDSQVRKLRQRRAPKAMEYAMKKAGVNVQKLREHLIKNMPGETAGDELVLEGTAKKGITDSDSRALTTASDEELSTENKVKDTLGTEGMTISTSTGAQIADASTRNNSRSKLQKANGNLQSKSLTLSDLNNLYEEEVNKETDAGDAAAQQIVKEVERRHRNKLFDVTEQEEVEGAVQKADDEPVHQSTPEKARPAGKAEPVSEKPAAGKSAGEAKPEGKVKKEPKGKIGTAWDKVVREVAKAKVEVPAWDTLTPEQKTKATDKIALNGKLTLHDLQAIVTGKRVVQPAPVVKPAAPKIDEKSAATVAKVRKSTVASTKEKTGSDFMAKLNAAAAAKKVERPTATEGEEKPDANAATGTGVPSLGPTETDPLKTPPPMPERDYGVLEMADWFGKGPVPVTTINDIEGFFNAHANTRAVANVLIENDIDGILFGIDEMFVAEDAASMDGALGSYLMWPTGQRAVVMSAPQLQDDNPHGAFTLTHELGHAADLIHSYSRKMPGRFSSRPELKVHLDGQIRRPVGAVARELRDLWRNSAEDNDAWSFMGYPFDRMKHPDLTNEQVHREIFAQLFAAYLLNKQRVEADAPLAAKFMEGVILDIQTINYEEELRRTKAGAKAEADGRIQRPAGNAERARPLSEAARSAGPVGSQEPQGRREGRAQASRRAERAIEALPTASRSGARRLYSTITDAAKKGFYGAAFTWDLADIAQKALPSVTKYMDLMGKKAAVKTHIEDQVEKILAQSERISKTDRLGRAQNGTGEFSINRFLHDSTMSGKWGYQDDATSQVRVDPEMAERFNNFSDEAQELIKVIFRHGAAVLRMKQRIIKDEINNEYRHLVQEADHEPEKVAELENKRRAALQHYDSILFLTAGKPYAPLRRFGNYAVVARSQAMRDAMANDNKTAIARMQADENHYHVSFHETMGEAEEKANQLRGTGRYAEASAFEKEKGLDAVHGGRDMMSAFQRLRNLVKSELEMDPNDAVAKSLNGMMSDLYLQTLAETSARKAEIKRKNVAGADLDMLRAFATQGRADAHFIAALKHNGDVTDAMYEMRREAHDSGEGKAERMRLFNEFMTRHALHMNYTETRVQDAILRGTSLWMLATSPAYYLQNATQTPMITVPYLAGKHGYGRSWGAWTKAVSDLGPMVEGLEMSARMDFSKAPPDVKRMLDDLVAAGRIDIALDQDLGRFQSRAENAVAHGWNTVDRKLRGMQQRVEAINRVTAAVAAYRMELARNGGNHAAATEYASKVVRITHGDYSSFNTPKYLTPGGGLPAAKVLTQFRKFQIIQASLIVRLFNNAFGADTPPVERAAAKKALAFTIGHTVVMAGMKGLPGAALLGWLVAKMLADPDEPDDQDFQIRRLIGNEDMADLILQGAPAYFGLDLSGKLGMGNAFSLIPYSNVTGFDKASYSNALLGLSGPFIGGILPRFAQGAEQIGRGNWYKGLEFMLPTGFSNAMKGYRYATEGVDRKSGDTVLSPEEVSFTTALLQAMGLQTKQLTDRSFDQRVVQEFEQFYKDKTSRLIERYNKATKNGDAEAKTKVREEWMELQAARMRNGFPRQPLSTLLKAPINQRKREREVVNGVGATKGSRKLAHELDGI